MSRLKTGGYAPLFDRLEQSVDSEKNGAQWLDIANLESSVFKELSRISQTRSRLSFFEFLNKQNLTVLDYGLPDFYGNSVQNSDSRKNINQILVKAFHFFEPRLKNITIRYLVDHQNKSELKFEIMGNLMADESTEPVTFLVSSKDSIENYKLVESDHVKS